MRFSLHSHFFARKSFFTQCIVPLHVPFTRVQHCHPPTPLPSIYIINCGVGNPTVGSETLQVQKQLLQPPTWQKKNGLLHPDPYSEALSNPLRESAHFMAPLAFSMVNGHGHFFRIGPAEKPYFPPFVRPMRGLQHARAVQKVPAHMPTAWEGVPG
jgi:hypothetical protein